MTVVDFLGQHGITLYRAGRRLRGECLVCGASHGKRSGGAFWHDPGSGGSECREGGDIVELVRIQRGGTRREAAEWLVGPEFASGAVQPPRAFAMEVRPHLHPAGSAADKWVLGTGPRMTAGEGRFAQ